VEAHGIVELLSSISRRLARSLIPYLEAEGLSLTESLVLWKVRQNQFSHITVVAEQTGVSPSTLTGVLDRLAEKKLIERVQDPSDRRAVLMRATADTDALLERLSAVIDAKVGAVFGCLPEGTLDRLLVDLTGFLECLEQVDR
jgi:DNA-binding MarR family transcriptional regulator